MKTIKKNREGHVKLLAEARSNYFSRVRDGLTKELVKLQEGKRLITDSVKIIFNPPQDYTEAYDQAIAMFEVEVRDTVKLNQDQFSALVLDKWQWKQEFVASTMQYLGG